MAVARVKGRKDRGYCVMGMELVLQDEQRSGGVRSDGYIIVLSCPRGTELNTYKWCEW